ncbi:serine/threonine-protein kinase nek4-like [Plakobranchus ocellatus]|uniref:Serine/threonine-protein kinase Nek4 n=1 Tax=Plakobranchus ocellatus TaxID=259542 RepID=A0AAV4ANP7_9GAST|nr:serine/threonine-protein kinase nek4-like [Plakobranchus ocellatus]
MVDTEFERIKVIGKGSYGEVWLAKHKKDKKQYVLKKMNLGKASKRERKSAEQEAKLLSKLKHPNIVSYKDSFETDSGFLFIAMQYCEGGDLYARLKEQKGIPLEERQVVEWFVQIAMALQYMHERNILHRDLKTQNIFLTKSKIIKVGDLGIARVLDSAGDMATTLIGTPYYMSPELFSNKPYNHKSDVWALGCCVYEMTTLKHAFNAKDMNSLVYKILKGRMPPMPRQYSADLLVLMKSMLHQDPEKRPSVNRILRDPYIKRNIALFLEDTKKNSRRPSASSSAAPASSRPSSASSQRDPAQVAVSVAPVPAERNPASSRPEPDLGSASSQTKAQEQSSASSAVLKPSHVRKTSDSAVRELAPIRERLEENHKAPDSKGQDMTPPVKEVQSPKKESVPRKKKFSLLNHAGKNKGDEKEEKEVNKGANIGKPPLDQSKGNSRSLPEPQKPQQRAEEKSRPLPPPPLKAEESAGLPQRRDGQVRSKSTDSSSVSSSKEDNCISLDSETPRSLPNVSARRRRREQRSETAGSIENPHSARVRLRPNRSESERITQAEKNVAPARPPRVSHPVRARQPSLNDSTSSSDESQRPGTGDAGGEDENPKEKEKKRENKEMNNFICLLDTTLHLNHAGENSDDEEELVPVEVSRERGPIGDANSRSSSPPTPPSQEVARPEPEMHKSVSMPSVETLTNTSRLMDRIRLLHKDCIQGVGYSVLKKAYEILDKIDEDEVEPKLVDLLGKDKFDEYAGKIWQLKFCEESLFMA